MSYYAPPRLTDAIAERLTQIGDPDFMANDPCLRCSLFKCDEFERQCAYIVTTGHRPDSGAEAVVLELTDEERTVRLRQQKREHMRRVRARRKATVII